PPDTAGPRHAHDLLRAVRAGRSSSARPFFTRDHLREDERRAEVERNHGRIRSAEVDRPAGRAIREDVANDADDRWWIGRAAEFGDEQYRTGLAGMERGGERHAERRGLDARSRDHTKVFALKRARVDRV